jgi:CheY-like chemotaxis protein
MQSAGQFVRIITMDTRNSPPNSKHVLVVDDDIELTRTWQELLQAHDYRASTAATGVQALRLVMSCNVDAILCDLSMPELAGNLFYFAVGRVRPQLLKRFTFVTANADNPLYETFLKSVKVPVFAKPVSFDRLLERLKAVIGN